MAKTLLHNVLIRVATDRKDRLMHHRMAVLYTLLIGATLIGTLIWKVVSK